MIGHSCFLLLLKGTYAEATKPWETGKTYSVQHVKNTFPKRHKLCQPVLSNTIPDYALL